MSGKTNRKKKRNGWLWANLSMIAILAVSIYGYYWAASQRVLQGYWTADPMIMLIHEICHALLQAAFIGWLITAIVIKTRK